MNEIDVTWGRATKVWWSLAWRSLLLPGVAGFVVGFTRNRFGDLVFRWCWCWRSNGYLDRKADSQQELFRFSGSSRASNRVNTI